MRQLNILSSILFPVIIFLSIPQIGVGNQPSKTKYIVIDQFGYRPEARKIAVIRNPKTGFDAEESFSPGNFYAVISVEDSSQVLSGTPVAWNNGSTNSSSGDKAWWFDFSELKDEGTYFILDIDSNLCSCNFEIKENIYEEVMMQAMRTFFYQRSGFEKQPPFACEEWADEASHLQDKHARDFLDKNNPATEKDVSGGWYDAGDYNKYTSWTANYIVDFMKAFIENPGVWGDNYNIPESGNGVPDILDEAKWGLEHLLRLQLTDGSLLSIVGVAHASPPSAATGPSYYGRPNTSGTLNAAAAFAIASKVYRSAGMKIFADSLRASAVRAWNWAGENPSVIFRNNEGNTQGLGAGQQETNDYGRLTAKLEAASFLFEVTGEAKYKNFFESNYNQIHLMQWTFAYPFETTNQETLLYYTTLDGISSSVKSAIISKYNNAMNGSENFTAISEQKDPFLAHIKDYTWGSNSVKAGKGLMFTDFVHYGINSSKNGQALEAAENYIHYIHGVNPLNMVYLSNMYNFGAENCVNEFYHSWFTDGSSKWDRVGESTYGPAPGFLTGGPNPGYDWDGCCPNGCGSSSNNAKCYSESIAPPKDQPDQKSYKDFNTSWPLNSWSVTENSCGYQISYIRLLARFLPAKYDCAGTFNGSAAYDACGICSGGTTGLSPENNPDNCVTTSFEKVKLREPQIFPNPASTWLHINYHSEKDYNIQILNTSGQILISENARNNQQINIQNLPSGQFIVVITDAENSWKSQLIKL